MNASKIIVCAIGATLMISATTYGALARSVDGVDGAGNRASELRGARPEIAGIGAAIGHLRSSLGAQIALNTQSLPLGRSEDDDYRTFLGQAQVKALDRPPRVERRIRPIGTISIGDR